MNPLSVLRDSLYFFRRHLPNILQLCLPLVVVEAPDVATAEAIAAADPYAKAGLFESVEVRPWNWVFNKPAA